MEVTPVAMRLRKKGAAESQLLAEKLNKRKCWMFEISYPDKATQNETSVTSVELQRVASACGGCWLFKCSTCPSAFYKPSRTPFK
jgi:hypothetical protein